MLFRFNGFENTKIALFFIGGGQGEGGGEALKILEFPFLKVEFAIKNKLKHPQKRYSLESSMTNLRYGPAKCLIRLSSRQTESRKLAEIALRDLARSRV